LALAFESMTFSLAQFDARGRDRAFVGGRALLDVVDRDTGCFNRARRHWRAAAVGAEGCRRPPPNARCTLQSQGLAFTTA
jgi:hypothetical protein